VAASYWAATLAGIRPRSLSSIPRACAQARMSRLRRRLAAVRTARRGIFPALRACSMNGASCARSRAAFFELRSISNSAPLIPNRSVSSAGLPSRSSCSVTLVLLAIPTPRDGDRQIRAVQARCYARKGDAHARSASCSRDRVPSSTPSRLHPPLGTRSRFARYRRSCRYYGWNSGVIGLTPSAASQALAMQGRPKASSKLSSSE